MIMIDMEMPETCFDCPMDFGGWCGAAPNDIEERVAPTVDEARAQKKPSWCPLQEERKGEWKEVLDPFYGRLLYPIGYSCSQCKMESKYKYNYCPNCGSYNGG